MGTFFALSAITGCIEPTTGITSRYDVMYNKDKIISFYKRDYEQNFTDHYACVVIFDNYKQNFVFLDKNRRDDFYNFLKT